MYIRQSTPGQVRNNLESQRLQYALVDRARQLGWAEVDVVDEDLGFTASGVHRPGFERMLGSVCEGKIGAIFSIEASALRRRGWRAPAVIGTRCWSSVVSLGFC